MAGTCVVGYEGKICNLDKFESYHIEDHPVVDGEFYVKGTWDRTSGSTGSTENLFQGSEADCKKYVRDVLSEKIGVDKTSALFKQFYGGRSPKTTGTSESEASE